VPLTPEQQRNQIVDGRVKFQIEIPADELMDGLEALNDTACDQFGNHLLQDMHYRVVTVRDTESDSYVKGSLIIEVDAMLDPDDC